MFAEYAQETFPTLDQAITDDELIESLREGNHQGVHATYNKSIAVTDRLRTVARDTFHESAFAADLDANHAAAARLSALTFSATPFSLHEEILDTVTTMPLNLIEIAQRKASALQLSAPVYRNLGNIASILSADWFKDVIDQAALTGNAWWETLATVPFWDNLAADDHRFEQVNYMYEPDGDVLRFQFDGSTRQALLGGLKGRNLTYRSTPDSKKAGQTPGTSAGCPARLKHAMVSPKDDWELAERFSKPFEALVGEHERSGIELSMACVGRLLTRAAILDERGL